MTREEAIDRLRKISEKTPIRTNGDDLVAITMAIQALSQEPCDDTVSIRKDALKTRVGNIVAYNVEWLKKHWQMEMDIVCGVEPCTDAVSREDVLNGLRGCICDEWVKTLFATMVKQLPSVTQKSGKWTLMYEPKNMVVCSECGKCAYMYQDKTSAFCPNCGAKMVEPQEGSDKE